MAAGHSASTAFYSVSCGIAPEREPAPERTILSSPWARWRAYRLLSEARRALAFANERQSVLRALGKAALDDRLQSLRPALCGRRVRPAQLPVSMV